MPEIVLTEEQARVLREAGDMVPVRGPDGLTMGALDPQMVTSFERLRRHRADPQPGTPAEVVHRRLLAMQAEWDRLGGFDEAYGMAFWVKLRAADA